MTEHTPGPWEWAIHDASMASLQGPKGEFDIVLSSSPCNACEAWANPKEWRWGRCTTPTEANARLIAAAPDLLDALKAMVAGRQSDAWAKAAAAIAKATGDH